MGTYDRSLQWRMMQQRHAHGGLTANPYFASGYSALGTTAGGERRATSVQALCTASNTNNSDPSPPTSTGNYYASDDRQAVLKRQRLSKAPPPSSSASSSGPPPRSSPLASYLPSASEYSTYPTSTTSSSSSVIDTYGATNASQEFSNDWFPARSSAGASSQGLTVNTSSSFTSANENNNAATLNRQASLASPTTIFGGMENLMADYETGFYSLWNGPNGPGVLGYDSESTPTDRQNQIYDELKIDYPQLPDLNQGDLEYIYGTMEPPTGRTSEPHIERAYGADVHRGTKRDRPSDETTKGLVSPTQSSLMSPSGFRNLARSTTIETKRPAPRVQASPYSESSSVGQATTPVGASSTAGAANRRPSSSSGSAPSAKRPRSRQCDFPGCENRARSHQKCKKHGGAHQCVYEGCMKNSQSRGLCIAHGGGSRCKVDGCTRASQSKGRCKSHGGGEYCAVEGCRKKAHLKHLCRTHGGGVRCKDSKCMKWAQRKGWCMAHAKEVLGT